MKMKMKLMLIVAMLCMAGSVQAATVISSGIVQETGTYNLSQLGTEDWMAFGLVYDGAWCTETGSSFTPVTPGLLAQKTGGTSTNYTASVGNGFDSTPDGYWRTLNLAAADSKWLWDDGAGTFYGTPNPAYTAVGGVITHENKGSGGTFALIATPRQNKQTMRHEFTLNPTSTTDTYVLDLWGFFGEESRIFVNFDGNLAIDQSIGAEPVDNDWRVTITFTVDTLDPIDVSFQGQGRVYDAKKAKLGMAAMSFGVVPEPATLVLLGLGGLTLLRKRK